MRRQEDEVFLTIDYCVSQHKLALYRYYSNRDSNIDGHIEPRVWASGVTEVLGLKLKWLSLRKLLWYGEHTDCEGLINYVKFLQGSLCLIDSVGLVLYTHLLILRAIQVTRYLLMSKLARN